MKNFITKNFKWIGGGIISITLAMSVTSCGKSSTKISSGNARQRTFSAQGVIKQISFENQEIVIQHGDITNYMPAMTMPFSVKNTNELNGLKVGETISFHLVVSPGNEWVEQLTPLVVASVAPQTNQIDFLPFIQNLKTGDSLPPYEFTNSHGTKIKLADFKGQALAIGFFLPTPNQPEVVATFSGVQKLLQQNQPASQNWQLICVSLDSKLHASALANFDKEVSVNSAHWQFLTGDTETLSKFASQSEIVVWPQTNSVAYNSRVVVVNANGKVRKIFKGKDWTANDLAGELIKATAIL